ncbi:Protein STIG1 [Hibiscus syriacus]|uniref:Protein STIG1 n=1 Tax=Hibiscus syriacus TaxID=106335 RepID=A0A6A3C528_HIBSY|nr:Protein STIG1 [Hibiscus syriacus]
MASNNILKLISILSLTISFLLSLHPQATFPFEIEDFDEKEEYVVDHPLIAPNIQSRSRFLTTSPKKDKIRKGCGNRCRFRQSCCGGVCTDVVYNVDNCGKCDNRCLPGVKCEFGYCGYA